MVLFCVGILTLCACNKKERLNLDDKNTKPAYLNRLPGDNSVYGLACEGCTDSVLILLPTDGSDPITYDIIDASAKHHVMGKPKVGDKLAIIVNPKDSTVADFILNIDELEGTWCYVVMPKMKQTADMSEKTKRRIGTDQLPDSLKERFLVPREYGFTLKPQWVAASVGYVDESTLADSPVEYPSLGYFTEWRIWNGKLVIYSGTPKQEKKNSQIQVLDIKADTCDIDYLEKDSLVLSSEGSSRSYYRNSDVANINKKAKIIAEQERQKALEEIKK